jgi:hypothetical protein
MLFIERKLKVHNAEQMGTHYRRPPRKLPPPPPDGADGIDIRGDEGALERGVDSLRERLGADS